MTASGSPDRDTRAPFPIAHIHWAMPPIVGGVETHLAEFTRQLVQRGHPVTVFTGTPRATPIPGVDIVQHELLNLRTYSRVASEDRLKAWVDELAGLFEAEFAQRGIQVVHGHNLHYFSPVPALALNRIATSHNVTLHNTYHSVWPDGHGIAQLCKGWAGHHAWSHHVVEYCSRELGVRPTLGYPGIRLDDYARATARRVRSGAFDHHILHPARLVPEKGADLSIRMIDRLRTEGIHASLVLTDGEMVDWTGHAIGYRDSIETLITRLNLADRVQIRSARFDEMPALYADADVVVYPSSYPEPLGLVPLESMAAARPIIVTRTGGLPETVTDAQTGYIIEPGDINALVDRVRKLLLDPVLAQTLGAAGQKRAHERFNLNTYVDWMLDGYQTDTQNGTHRGRGDG